MTEAEWLTCADPLKMLDLLSSNASDRKLRLFTVACCRRIWSYLTEKRSRWIVEISERYADNRVTQKRLNSASSRADTAFFSIHLGGGGDVEQQSAQAVLGLGVELQVGQVLEFAAATFGAVARGEAYKRIWQTPGKEHTERWAEDDSIRLIAETNEAIQQASLVRDIFGNPFHPLSLNPTWLTPAITALAQTIYDNRNFERMSELADALEVAGCTNAEILAHCREPGPHVRGCWVVDLLLWKE